VKRQPRRRDTEEAAYTTALFVPKMVRAPHNKKFKQAGNERV